ncbi:hypothetical protein BGZ76_010189 [Entomortierella beljakovae]|nr:hypothetical protein BGZ76_010189 [Entomortierella beljakovae]
MASNRIVSSTIIRPETDTRIPGKKRSFPDAPEPARRTDISSRLGGISNQSETSGSTLNQEGEVVSTTTEGSANPAEATAVPTTGNQQDGDASMNEPEDRTKRARRSLNPVEDAKRGRRMMGMILGTLTQFKKQTEPSNTNKDPGLASREAVQERVREKLRKEKELNEERSKRDKEEWERQKQVLRQGLGKPHQVHQNHQLPDNRRNEAKWENGFILTETRPRIRYMPKVLNDTMQKRFDDQKREREERAAKQVPHAASTNTSLADAAVDSKLINPTAVDINSESAANMDLDLDGVVTTNIVVDVKDNQKKSDLESPTSGASSVTVPDSPAVAVDGSVEKNTEGDVAMTEANSEGAKDGSSSDDLIKISLV